MSLYTLMLNAAANSGNGVQEKTSPNTVVNATSKKKSKLTVKNITITSVSGGVSGALEILFTYPFEFAKTQQQLQPEVYKGRPFTDCWKDTWRKGDGFPKGFTGSMLCASQVFPDESELMRPLHCNVCCRSVSGYASAHHLRHPSKCIQIHRLRSRQRLLRGGQP